MPTIAGVPLPADISTIKSRQNGTAFINASVTSTTITINAINPVKSLIVISYGYALVNSSGNPIYVGDLGHYSVYYDILTETSVRFTRFQTGSYGGSSLLNFNWQLVEWN